MLVVDQVIRDALRREILKAIHLDPDGFIPSSVRYNIWEIVGKEVGVEPFHLSAPYWIVYGELVKTRSLPKQD